MPRGGEGRILARCALAEAGGAGKPAANRENAGPQGRGSRTGSGGIGGARGRTVAGYLERNGPRAPRVAGSDRDDGAGCHAFERGAGEDGGGAGGGERVDRAVAAFVGGLKGAPVSGKGVVGAVSKWQRTAPAGFLCIGAMNQRGSEAPMGRRARSGAPQRQPMG